MRLPQEGALNQDTCATHIAKATSARQFEFPLVKSKSWQYCGAALVFETKRSGINLGFS